MKIQIRLIFFLNTIINLGFLDPYIRCEKWWKQNFVLLELQPISCSTIYFLRPMNIFVMHFRIIEPRLMSIAINIKVCRNKRPPFSKVTKQNPFQLWFFGFIWRRFNFCSSNWTFLQWFTSTYLLLWWVDIRLQMYKYWQQHSVPLTT